MVAKSDQGFMVSLADDEAWTKHGPPFRVPLTLRQTKFTPKSYRPGFYAAPWVVSPQSPCRLPALHLPQTTGQPDLRSSSEVASCAIILPRGSGSTARGAFAGTARLRGSVIREVWQTLG